MRWFPGYEDVYPYFPEVDVAMLQFILARMEESEGEPGVVGNGYLDSSPYSETFKEFLRSLNHKGWSSRIGGDGIGVEELEKRLGGVDLLSETADLLKDIKNLQTRDVKEEIAVARIRSQLLEKVAKLQERAIKVDEIGRFQAKVMNMFETILTADQRVEAMHMLTSLWED